MSRSGNRCCRRHRSSGCSKVHSELESQRQLDRTRSADLIERIESAVRAAGAEEVSEGLCRAAKERAGKEARGAAKVGMVQDIEKLAPETEAHSLSDAEDPLHADIRLGSVETAQHVAAEIALLSGRRRGESRLVEDLAAGISGTEEFQRYSGIQIRARIERGTCGQAHCAYRSNRWRRSGQNKRIQRPSAQYHVAGPIRPRKRQIVGHASSKCVPDIKIRVASVYLRTRD